MEIVLLVGILIGLGVTLVVAARGGAIVFNSNWDFLLTVLGLVFLIVGVIFLVDGQSSPSEGNIESSPSVFYGYSFPDPFIINFDTESGKGSLMMEITLQVGSDQEITNLGAKSQLLKQAVTTFLAKKETQEILPDLVTNPGKMGEYIQEAIKEEVGVEPKKVVFDSFIRQ